MESQEHSKEHSRIELDEIANRFESQWDIKKSFDPTKWLEQVATDQNERLLAELVKVDLELRRSNGMVVAPNDYKKFGPVATRIVEQFVRDQQCGDETQRSRSAEIDNDLTIPPQKNPDNLRRIDNYELIRKLGGGGMGDVYLARHHKFRARYYAVKLLRPDLVSSEAMSRFEHEIDVAGQFQHPNIVFAFDAGRYDNSPYLVMEFVQGCDLQVLINDHGQLPIENACELIYQAVIGLGYAFSKTGLTHRDIKPANLMLAVDHKVKVLDLGLARLRDQSHSMGLTQEGQLLGTPDYMAPEQWSESSNVDTRADIYSMGCTLFALLTSKPPFFSSSKSSVAAKMSAHILDPVPDIRSIREEVPHELAAIIKKCLSKEPQNRYQTPEELADAIKPFAENADLTVYNVISESISPESFVPTKPVALDDSIRKVGPSGSAANGRFAAVTGIVAIALIAAALTVAWQFWPTTKNSITAESATVAGSSRLERLDTKSIKIQEFEVLAARNAKLPYLPVEELKQLRPGEPVRFSVKLSEPGFVKLYWVDAAGDASEIYPNVPKMGNLETGPVTWIQSPSEPDTGWPLNAIGANETALLIVSRTPLADYRLPKALDVASANQEMNNEVVVRHEISGLGNVQTKYEAARTDDTRGLETNSIKVSNPIRSWLEDLRSDGLAIQAVQIPTKVNQ